MVSLIENMIILLKKITNGKEFYLSEKRDYIVGRKQATILILDDHTISRKHAIIHVKDDHVTLQDCGSKYHTFLNGVEIEPNNEVKLKHLDQIQFGTLDSKFSFVCCKFMTAASALSSAKKLALKNDLLKCSAYLADKWSDKCTHLTVEQITLTIKVLQALIDQKPIVTPSYWTDYAEALRNNTDLPDIENYNKPPVAEMLLRSDFQYKFDPKRKTLFSDKVFVFPTTTMKNQMEEVVTSCGGRCISWETNPLNYTQMCISTREHVIINPENADHPLNDVIKDFNKKNKRAVPLAEIALAIVHCSCEINCNPNFNKVDKVFAARPINTCSVATPLVMETQTENMGRVEIKTEQIIPSTVDDRELCSQNLRRDEIQDIEPVRGKRRIDDQADGILMKKPKIEKGNAEKGKEVKLEDPEPIKLAETTTLSQSEVIAGENNPQLSQKRKAQDEIPNSPKTKKPNAPGWLVRRAVNPPIPSEETPFSLSKRSIKVTSSPVNPPQICINPFALGTRINRKIAENANPKKEIVLVPVSINVSCNSSIKKSFSGTAWTCKSSTVKKELLQEYDSQLAEISKAFKDCVKVRILPVFNRHEESGNDVTDASVSFRNGKSFKRFKKVAPVKPQNSIIGKNQLTKVGLGDVSELEKQYPASTKVPMRKKFNI